MVTLLVRAEDTHQDAEEAIPHTAAGTVAIHQEVEDIPHHVATTAEEATADSASDHPTEAAVKSVVEAEEITVMTVASPLLMTDVLLTVMGGQAVDTMSSVEGVEVVGGMMSLQGGMMMISVVGMEVMSMVDHPPEVADALHHDTEMITTAVKGLVAAAGIRDTHRSTAPLTLDCKEGWYKSNRIDRLPNGSQNPPLRASHHADAARSPTSTP